MEGGGWLDPSHLGRAFSPPPAAVNHSGCILRRPVLLASLCCRVFAVVGMLESVSGRSQRPRSEDVQLVA